MAMPADVGPHLERSRPCGSILLALAWSRRRWKRLAIWSWAERKRCACRADLNRFICRSRRRVGWCEFSARLFSPLCWRCSTPGITSRFAAP